MAHVYTEEAMPFKTSSHQATQQRVIWETWFAHMHVLRRSMTYWAGHAHTTTQRVSSAAFSYDSVALLITIDPAS